VSQVASRVATPASAKWKKRSTGQPALAAAIIWYDRGLVSHGEGPELAGMTRAAFIDALGLAKVDALQTTAEELKDELERSERERTVDALR
jgi:Uncharacterised protein family (UPF0175)